MDAFQLSILSPPLEDWDWDDSEVFVPFSARSLSSSLLPAIFRSLSF
jgi:hypothetical protein